MGCGAGGGSCAQQHQAARATLEFAWMGTRAKLHCLYLTHACACLSKRFSAERWVREMYTFIMLWEFKNN